MALSWQIIYSKLNSIAMPAAKNIFYDTSSECLHIIMSCCNMAEGLMKWELPYFNFLIKIPQPFHPLSQPLPDLFCSNSTFMFIKIPSLG